MTVEPVQQPWLDNKQARHLLFDACYRGRAEFVGSE